MSASPTSDLERAPLAPWELEATPPTAAAKLAPRARLSAPFCAAVAAASLFSVALLLLISWTLKMYVTPAAPLFQWTSFALHPWLMTLAFGVLSPLASVAFKGLELGLGVSRARAKAVHLSLMSAASAAGLVGAADMWRVHEEGAAAQVGKGWAVHLQSAHSWGGALALVLFTLNWCVGLGVFALPFANAKTRRMTLRPHAFVGAVSLFGCLGSISTGCLSLGFRGDNASQKDILLKLIALLAYLLGIALALVHASAPGQDKSLSTDALQR